MKTTLLATALTLSAATAWCAKPEVIPELRQWTDAAAAGAYTLCAETRRGSPAAASPALARSPKASPAALPPLARAARAPTPRAGV